MIFYLRKLHLIGVRQMVKDLIHESTFLAGKSEIAAKEDLHVAQDLLDTLIANKTVASV